MEKSYYRFRLSAFQAIGIIMTVLGILVLVLTGIRAVKHESSSRKMPQSGYLAEGETSGEEYGDDTTEPESITNAKRSSYSAASGLLLGAALIIGAVPFLYMPHGEGFSFRRRRRRVSDDDMTDKEFDYPDDEFDFIIDEETRKKLIEEKFRRIYEKHHKQ